MTESIWNQRGDRQYQYGVDRGMVYPHDMESGVPWNGLVSVSESTEGGNVDPIYIDGQAVSFDVSPGRMRAVIDALHYPDEFGEHCLGESGILGLSVTAYNQPRGMFDLAYRQMIGDDIEGPGANYRIVLIRGAIATDSDQEYETVSDTTSPATFSWDIDTAVEIYDHDEFEEPDEELPFAERSALPTAKLVVDTRKVAPELVERIEAILYHPQTPRMVDLDDIKTAVTELNPDPVVNLATNPRGRPAEEIVEGDPEEAYENLVSYIQEYTNRPIEWNTEPPNTSQVLYERADNLVRNPRGRNTSGTVTIVEDAENARVSRVEEAISLYTSLDVEWSESEPGDTSTIWVNPNTPEVKEYVFDLPDGVG